MYRISYLDLNMYPVSAQGFDERMINVHYYYYYGECKNTRTASKKTQRKNNNMTDWKGGGGHKEAPVSNIRGASSSCQRLGFVRVSQVLQVGKSVAGHF